MVLFGLMERTEALEREEMEGEGRGWGTQREGAKHTSTHRTKLIYIPGKEFVHSDLSCLPSTYILSHIPNLQKRYQFGMLALLTHLWLTKATILK